MFVIFNQFEEMGNVLWHYQVTGKAIADAYESIKTEKKRALRVPALQAVLQAL